MDRHKKGFVMKKEVTIKGLVIGKGIPKICVPIVSETTKDILAAAREAEESSADLVEWRADFWEELEDKQALETILSDLQQVLKTKPLLFTIRTKAEGGEFQGSSLEYEKLVKTAAKGADMVDIEVFMKELKAKELIEQIQKEECVIVGSNHDFHKTPQKEEIIRRLCFMQQVGVDIPKIAVMPQNAKDVLTLLSATEEMTTHYADRPIVTMSMAGTGIISRISGEIFGSAITFGSLFKASAPGQLELNELRNVLDIIHKDKEK